MRNVLFVLKIKTYLIYINIYNFFLMCVGYFYAEREHSRHANHLIFHYALLFWTVNAQLESTNNCPGRICAGPRVCVCVSVVKTILEVGRKFCFSCALCPTKWQVAREGLLVAWTTMINVHHIGVPIIAFLVAPFEQAAWMNICHPSPGLTFLLRSRVSVCENKW